MFLKISRALGCSPANAQEISVTHRFVNELRAGDRIENDAFLIRSKDLRTTTQGGLYIHAVLVDRSGQMVARAWQATEEMYRDMPEGGVLRFKGRVESYKGNLQFIIDGIMPAEAGSFDLGDFLPKAEGDAEARWARVTEILSGVKHPHLKALLAEFLADEELMSGFRTAPAAAVLHHAYIGGLMEHTLALLELALKVVPLYERLNLDLVLTGLFLHDIGKAKELTYETAIGYSDQGQLVGHIALATMWIEKYADAAAERSGKPFPKDLRWALQHIILSHHGQYEFGSPKLPAIPEAIAIHYLDNLDAKLNMFYSAIDNSRDATSHWTEYVRPIETKVFKVDYMKSGD